MRIKQSKIFYTKRDFHLRQFCWSTWPHAPIRHSYTVHPNILCLWPHKMENEMDNLIMFCFVLHHPPIYSIEQMREFCAREVSDGPMHIIIIHFKFLRIWRWSIELDMILNIYIYIILKWNKGTMKPTGFLICWFKQSDSWIGHFNTKRKIDWFAEMTAILPLLLALQRSKWNTIVVDIRHTHGDNKWKDAPHFTWKPISLWKSIYYLLSSQASDFA